MTYHVHAKLQDTDVHMTLQDHEAESLSDAILKAGAAIASQFSEGQDSMFWGKVTMIRASVED